jgi:hypothetical protein
VEARVGPFLGKEFIDPSGNGSSVCRAPAADSDEAEHPYRRSSRQIACSICGVTLMGYAIHDFVPLRR